MDKILVLCVDRDNDIGRKAGIQGPVIGRKENIDLAVALALADPGDTDANAIFESVRQFDLATKEREVAVATISGDIDVGLKSDSLLTEQLRDVLAQTKADQVLLVSDGAEDEHIIPIIQSYAKIASVRRLVIKKSEKLEGMYYVVHDFIHRVIEEPRLARLVLVPPSLVFILYSLLGTAGWRLILGGTGLYLMMKALQLESIVSSLFIEMKTSFQTRRTTFFLYVVAFVMAAISLKGGYEGVKSLPSRNLLEMSAAFVRGSTFFVLISSSFVLLGKMVGAHIKKRRVLRYAPFYALFVSISVVGFEASQLILTPQIGFFRLTTAVAGGFLFVSLTFTADRFLKPKIRESS